MKTGELDIDEVIANFPHFHRKEDGSPWFLGVSGETLKTFMSLLKPNMRTVETGAGFSTLAFILSETKHTAICPDDYLAKNITDWCKERKIDYSKFEYVEAFSQNVVSDWKDELDFVFIDGDHAFPIPMIDFYYLARKIKVGGYIAIDDTNIWTGDVLVKHLAVDEDWSLVVELDGKTAIFKREMPHRDRGVPEQSFVLANSRNLPIEWYKAICL